MSQAESVRMAHVARHRSRPGPRSRATAEAIGGPQPIDGYDAEAVLVGVGAIPGAQCDASLLRAGLWQAERFPGPNRTDRAKTMNHPMRAEWLAIRVA